jgi:hypothetical protein
VFVARVFAHAVRPYVPADAPIVHRQCTGFGDRALTWEHISLETDRFGTTITHALDETGEHVCLSTEETS